MFYVQALSACFTFVEICLTFPSNTSIKFKKFFMIFLFSRVYSGNSLAVQWLGLCAFTAEGPGSVPGQETRILQAAQHGQENPKQNKTRVPILFLKN